MERLWLRLLKKSTDRGIHAIPNRTTTIMRIEKSPCTFQKARPTPPFLTVKHLTQYSNIPKEGEVT